MLFSKDNSSSRKASWGAENSRSEHMPAVYKGPISSTASMLKLTLIDRAHLTVR